MSERLTPISQEWFDDNRERFQAKTQAVETKSIERCQHYLIRVDKTRVQCKYCNAGWIDNGVFRIENGVPL